MRDNIVADDDPPVITVQYEIKILCAKEILLRDGTKLKVQCIRGDQKAQTNTKMLKANTVYFQQKVVMKTTLEKKPGDVRYGKKELSLNLVSTDDKQVLGKASIDLAKYSKCHDRRLFSVELQKSQFPEALIDFYITASTQVGTGRSYSVKVKPGGMRGAAGDIATSS